MILRFIFSLLILLLIKHNFALAQFEIFLPSENTNVTADYYDEWIANDISEYSGRYKYMKDEWEPKVYEANVIINIRKGENRMEWDENHNNEGFQKSVENLKIDNGEFVSGLRTGTFRKLFYKDKNGKSKISYQLRINGDCCDGACDDSFEMIESNPQGQASRKVEEFYFKILDNEINFDISEIQLKELYPNLTVTIDNNIESLVNYSLEEKSESDFNFMNITFCFFDNKLFQISIQNDSNEQVSDEISDLTKSFNFAGEVTNEIDAGYINVPTVIYKKDNIRISLTEVHFTFCTITNEIIEKNFKELHPTYFK